MTTVNGLCRRCMYGLRDGSSGPGGLVVNGHLVVVGQGYVVGRVMSAMGACYAMGSTS